MGARGGSEAFADLDTPEDLAGLGPMGAMSEAEPFPAPPPEPPATRRTVTRTRALAVRESRAWERPERLATEEPMEIRAGGPGQEPVPVAVTMRTPGHDFELAVGFLAGEGLISSRDEVSSVRYCELPPGEPQHYNIVTVGLHPAVRRGGPVRRHFYATSSLRHLRQGVARAGRGPLRSAPPRPGPRGVGVLGLPEAAAVGPADLRADRRPPRRRRVRPTGRRVPVREDVGRHNALDKLVGRALLAGELPCPTGCSWSPAGSASSWCRRRRWPGPARRVRRVGPSSLAVETADGDRDRLVGFVRGAGFNVYTHPERIDLEA